MSSKKITRIITATASVVVAGSLLAACGGGGSSSNKGGAGSSGAVTRTGTGARLTGTYSAADFWGWVPNSMYPSDVSEIQGGLYTTGHTVSVNSKYHVASTPCDTMIEDTSGPGFGEEAYLIDQGENAAKTVVYSYGAYEFATAADASEFVKELAAKFASCGSFTYSSDSGSAPVTMSDGSSSESAEVTSGNTVADLRASITFNGKTNVGDYVFAADGNVVVFANSFSSNGAVDTAVDNAKLVEEILSAFTSGQAKWVASHAVSDYTTNTAEPTAPGSRIYAAVGGGAS